MIECSNRIELLTWASASHRTSCAKHIRPTIMHWLMLPCHCLSYVFTSWPIILAPASLASISYQFGANWVWKHAPTVPTGSLWAWWIAHLTAWPDALPIYQLLLWPNRTVSVLSLAGLLACLFVCCCCYFVSCIKQTRQTGNWLTQARPDRLQFGQWPLIIGTNTSWYKTASVRLLYLHFSILVCLIMLRLPLSEY